MPVASPIENLVDRFVASAITNVVDTVQEAVSRYSTSRTSRQMVTFFQEISQGPGEAQAAAAHEELADQMKRSVVASWGQAKGKLRPAVYDPQRASRDSGGMEKAVHEPELAVGTAQGVEFGPIAMLDRDARQWARLNFGALPTGQGSNERFSVRFSNLPAIQYVFDEPARPPYGLPRGGFKGPDGKWQGHGEGIPTGAFYPRGGPQQFATRGNVGYNYLDAGIRRFFELLPTVYGRLFRNVLEPSQRRGRPPILGETQRIKV